MDTRQAPPKRKEDRDTRVWNSQRKLLANLIPGAVIVPVAAAGLWMIAAQATESGEMVGSGLLVLSLAVPAGWIAVNWFGLFDNRRMRKEMTRRVRSDRKEKGAPMFFVGLASPSHFSVIDPYEDVGFVILHAERIEFFGDFIRLSLDRRDVTDVRMRPNLLTFVGLGCWVTIEGKVGDLAVQMKLWLRERPTLTGNFLLSRAFRDRLKRWLNDPSPNQA